VPSWHGLFREMARSTESELMDGDGCSEAELAQGYKEIESTSRWLGNRAVLMRLLRRPAADGHVATSVLDIGCGQGALLLEIHRRLGVAVMGMDLREAPADAPVPIVTGNAAYDPVPTADAAICVFLTHHLTEADFAAMIANVAKSCRRLIVVDVVRHPVPLMLFRLFVAPWLGPITANDGQVSVRRGFTAAEMRAVVEGALASSGRPVAAWRHTVAPLWIRQVVDICWEEEPPV
jgi:SAM-dependent methyltransferase